jgi:hypothetical protein
VLVKITGKSRGLAGVRDQFRYIGGGKAEKFEQLEEREADAVLEAKRETSGDSRLTRDVITETGERITTQAGLNDLRAEWRRGRDSMV